MLETKLGKLVSAYRQFWKGAAAAPIHIAFDVLRDADRRLFPDREAIAEAIAGQIMRAADSTIDVSAVLSFARQFVAAFPQQAIDDPGFVRIALRSAAENLCAVLEAES